MEGQGSLTAEDYAARASIVSEQAGVIVRVNDQRGTLPFRTCKFVNNILGSFVFAPEEQHVYSLWLSDRLALRRSAMYKHSWACRSKRSDPLSSGHRL